MGTRGVFIALLGLAALCPAVTAAQALTMVTPAEERQFTEYFRGELAREVPR